MKNILILSNNFEFCKDINNNMPDDTRILNISSKYEEGIQNCLSIKPDIIILEMELQYYKIVFLLNEIEKLKLYNPIVIIITSNNMYDVVNKYPYCSIIKRKTKNYLMLYRLFRIIEEEAPDDDALENKIKAEMFKSGFEMKNKGDYFILYVLKYIKTHESIGTKLEKEIYPIVSKAIGVSEKQVKWNINYSVSSVYETKTHQLCRYLNISDSQKPTTKYILFTLVNNI